MNYKNLRLLRTGWWLLSVQIALLLPPKAQAAVTLNVTPSAVSNTYSGTITLTVTGVPTGDTVVIQKFVDANTNGVVDAGDFLVQQFQLADGQGPQVISGVTNINIPYDANSATGAITAQLNLRISGIAQLLVGQFAFVLSSPAGHFGPLTNLFNVTNFPFAQSFTGRVLVNGTNVPNAIVFLSQPSSKGDFKPQAGALANNAGSFTIKAAPG